MNRALSRKSQTKERLKSRLRKMTIKWLWLWLARKPAEMQQKMVVKLPSQRKSRNLSREAYHRKYSWRLMSRNLRMKPKGHRQSSARSAGYSSASLRTGKVKT